ncbi:hypothetical protein P4T54_24925 [Bacillus mycoides]|uniref:hypothetical protein n=1 Tax=Bacillus mycoides TaxID=1405 RepID=UPI002E212660|nr:hypothetical protein [Bacillus mycoides]MED1047662.1 hypothetical protein [Bacillus mycoides]MED1054399.1 hypothetical protein [Bacillus mycoides]
MNKTTVIVSTYDVGNPFIYEIHGYMTLGVMTEIDNDLIEQLETEILEGHNLNYDLRVEASYVEGETQYGSGEGDIHRIPSYWNLKVIEKIPQKGEEEQ